MQTDILIIDWSNLVYRAGHAGNTVLKNSNGVVTSTFHYVFRMLETYLKELQPGMIILAMDDPDHRYARKTFYPEYKALRGEARKSSKSEEIYSQIQHDKRVLETLLGSMPVITAFWDTLEADDVIAWACKYANLQGHKTIVSSDRDMFQLVNEEVSVYYPGKPARLINLNSWHEHLSAILKLEPRFVPSPDQFLDYKIMVGETGASSDNIPGVKGYGSKKAAALLNEHGTIEKAQKHLYDEVASKRELKVLEKRLFEKESKGIINRNRILMDLNQYINPDSPGYCERGLHVYRGVWQPEVLHQRLQEWELNAVMTGRLFSIFNDLAKANNQVCR